VENYSVAESIWSNAKSARQKLGREQKMPSEYTTLSQPIWSSNNISITKWAQAVVSYGAKQKLIVKFNCILNSFTNRLQIMDYSRLSFGPYEDNPINGYIIEIDPDLSNATLSITLLCVGDFSSLPTVLAESGEAISLETGELVEVEDASIGSVKISEMVAAEVTTIAAAGGVFAAAIPGIANNKISLSSMRDWIEGDLQSEWENYSITLMNSHINSSDPHSQYILDIEKSSSNGVATLDATGKVPSSQLPSFVDDVVEYSNLSSFPDTGESSKIYIALDTNLTYRWSGSNYVEISKSLALGETSETAYRGDRGKSAYDHSQSSGNPHESTGDDINSDLLDEGASQVLPESGTITSILQTVRNALKNLFSLLAQVYTKVESNSLLDGKSDTGHTHDDRYYTETESDSRYLSKDYDVKISSRDSYSTHSLLGYIGYFEHTDLASLDVVIRLSFRSNGKNEVSTSIGDAYIRVKGATPTFIGGILYCSEGSNMLSDADYTSMEIGVMLQETIVALYCYLPQRNLLVDYEFKLLSITGADFIFESDSVFGEYDSPPGMHLPVASIGFIDNTFYGSVNGSYTESQIDYLLNDKSDIGHNHDDRYYTETQVDELLEGKSEALHKEQHYAGGTDAVIQNSLSASVTLAPTASAVNAGLALKKDIKEYQLTFSTAYVWGKIASIDATSFITDSLLSLVVSTANSSEPPILVSICRSASSWVGTSTTSQPNTFLRLSLDAETYIVSLYAIGYTVGSSVNYSVLYKGSGWTIRGTASVSTDESTGLNDTYYPIQGHNRTKPMRMTTAGAWIIKDETLVINIYNGASCLLPDTEFRSSGQMIRVSTQYSMTMSSQNGKSIYQLNGTTSTSVTLSAGSSRSFIWMSSLDNWYEC